MRGFTGWWAPAGTPPDILKKLSDAMVLAGQAEVWTVGRLRVPFMVVTGVGRAGGAVIRSRSTGVVDVEGWEDPTHDPHRGATTALPRPAPPKD